MKKTFAVILSLCLAAAMLFSVTSVAFAGSREEPGDITFGGLMVCDNDECMIRINRIAPNDTWGYTVHASFANKSEETTYSFGVPEAYADGWEANPVFSITLEPGQTREGEILFPTRFFDKVGMDFYTDIEISFRVVDDDDYYADPVFEGSIHVYPYGEEAAESFEREELDTDVVLVDNRNMKVVVISGEKDDNWAFTMTLYIENKSETDFTIMMDEVMVNGCDADPYFTETVHAGRKMVADVGWFEDDFEMNEIDVVEYIEFLLTAFDSEEWESDGLVEDYFTVEFAD